MKFTGIKYILILIAFSVSLKIAYGQVPTYELTAHNFQPNGDFYTANELTFDISITSKDTLMLQYAGGLFVINFDTKVANGGLLSYEFAGPDTSDLPINLRPINPQIVPGSNFSQLVLSLNPFPDSGKGFNIPQFSFTKIIKMRLRTTATTFSMLGGPIGGWWIIDLEPVWSSSLTKIYAYLSRTTPVDITQPFNHYINDQGLIVNPVQLSSFTYVLVKNIVTLYWTTASETNNSGFDIESSGENVQWKKIGFVRGNGTTNETKRYSYFDKVSAGKYFYRLKQIDYNGNFEYFNLNNEVVVTAPRKIELLQNYPNPFNPSTKIFYSISKNGYISLKVYDITGKLVSTLLNEYQSAGYYEIDFNASDHSSGVYFYTLQTENFTETKRMILIR